MSDKAKIEKEVKIVVRALLLSAPIGLTAGEIERDFLEAQGYGIPYRELGFNSPSDLVESLQDVATCHWERGHAVFRGVADKTTKHIQSLVSRQNVDVRKCLKKRNALERQVRTRGSWRGGYSAGGSGRSYSSSSSRSYHQAPYPRPGGYGSGPGGRRSNSYPGNTGGGRPQSHIATIQSSSPAFLRTQLTSLLTSHPNGILNSQFDSIFTRKFGFGIDYAKLGFSGLTDLVKSLSSVISVEYLGEEKFRIYSNENFPKGTKEIPSLLATKNSRTTPKPLMEGLDNSNTSVRAKVLPVPDARKSVPFQSPQKAGGSARVPGRARRPVTSPSGPGDARSRIESAEPKTNPRERKRSERSGSGSPPRGTDVIDKQLCCEIQQILEESPDGVFAASLPSKYKALTGKELPLFSIGFYSVVELVSAIPNIVAIERQKKNSDWKLFDARTFVPSKAPAPEQERKKSPAVSEPVGSNDALDQAKANVRNVLLAHPTGVLLQDLADAYQKFHKSALPYQDFGVNDVNSLVLANPDTIKVVYKDHNQVYLHAQDQRLPFTASLYSTISKSIPQDAIGYGYSYPAAKTPPLNEYFPIYISTVYTPDKISIQLKDREQNVALETLMNQLESVYAYPEGEKYLMPDAMIAVNQICCALYHEDNNWHRGLITGVPNMDLVEVLYVDYGTSLRVPKSSLRLLKSCFMKLRIQAIDAKLAGIEPEGGAWRNETRDKLLELSFNKPLLALRVEDKLQKSVVSLLLCDTSTEEDIHINDLLVSEGLARFSDKKQSDDKALGAQQPSMHQQQQQPAEVSLQMLTGIGLPVPEDDPSLTYHWPDESTEVEGIIGRGIEGEHQTPHPEQPAGEGHRVTASGDGSRDKKGASSGVCQLPAALKEDGDQIEKMAAELSELEEGIEDSNQDPWTVKKVELITGQTLHLISFSGQGQYVTSVDIAHLIWSDAQDERALFDMIEREAGQLGEVIVEELVHEELSASLASQGVPLSKLNPTRLQLFLITRVASLVQVSGRQKDEVILELQALADEMPALEDDSDSMSRGSLSSESGSLEPQLDPAELTKMYDVLKAKRERILKDLMSNSGVGNVDEVMHIERLMKEIEEKRDRCITVGTSSSITPRSIGELSTQLEGTSLNSSIPLTPATPDDVFSSPRAAFSETAPAFEPASRDSHAQPARGPELRRHISERTAVGQKQTATISPLQRKSTGGLPPGQRGIGRGALSQKVAPPVVGKTFSEMMTGLNPNSPAFVPSPNRHDTIGSDLKTPLLPPSNNLFAFPPPPLIPTSSSPARPAHQGHGQPQAPKMLPGFPDVFQTVPSLPPNLMSSMPPLVPSMPPMPNRTVPLRMNTLTPPSMLGPPGGVDFVPGIGLVPPLFPPHQGLTNPGLPQPDGFDLLLGDQMMNPSLPPPPLYGLGRGHQPWSIND